MWAAFSALSAGIKIGVLVALLGLLSAFGYVCYDKGVHQSDKVISAYELNVVKLQGKLDLANANTQIKYVTQYRDRVQVVHDTVTKNTETIRTAVPDNFEFSKGWIYAYNQSVAGKVIDFDLAKQPGSSAIKANTALVTISNNNGICLANAEQLNSLIAWTNEVYNNGQNITASTTKPSHGLFKNLGRSKGTVSSTPATTSNTRANNGTN